MSTPDSVPVAVLPVVPRLSVVPRPVSQREALRAVLERLPVSVVLAAGAVVILTVSTVSSKLIAVNLSSLMYIDVSESARLLGSLSFLSIVLIVAALALLHRALRTIPAAESLSRQITVVALVGAHLQLILWLSRFLAAGMAAASSGTLASFMPNVFWWG